MNGKKLRSLLKKDENTKLDFKLRIDISTESGKKELAKDICAMANTRGGRAYIIMGIEDKTKDIVGIDESDLKEEQIQQIISSRCEPPIPITLEYIKINSKTIGIITIYDGNQKPYQVRENGAFYTRRGSTTDVMRKDEIITLLSDNLTLNAELCPIPRSNIEHLDIDLVKEYFRLHGLVNIENNLEEFMINAGIVIKEKESMQLIPTMGGLLVFSKYNNIYIPQNKIKIINRLSEKEEIKIIQGELLEMIDETESYLSSILPDNYPIIALYEGIKNAILYREYTIYDMIIEIKIDKNRIELISPGWLNRKKGGQRESYVKRNMWIYEKLMLLDSKKRFLDAGRGFSIIKQSFTKNTGRAVFLNSKKYNYFKILYPSINKYKNI